MQVDWLNFTPISALSGGILIGLSAAILVLCCGHVAGISGIIGGLLKPENQRDVVWRGAFLAGLMFAPLAYSLCVPDSLPHPNPLIDTQLPLLVLAGLLVGFGARLGSGCTSGHGVCGISRLSPRSIVATLTFMASGGITVFVIRHLVN